MRRSLAWYGLALGLTTIGLAGCPKGKMPGGMPSSGGACGDLGPEYAKLQAFLDASGEVDDATSRLENSVRDACRKMAAELQVNSAGDTQTVCKAVADGIKENLKIGLKTKVKLHTNYKPAECKVNVNVAAKMTAKCEAKASADVKVKCSGQCGGTCNGSCDGKCSGAAGSGGSGGQCNGQCEGTCGGSCSGSCSGSADVEASAECKASAEAHANLSAECTPPKVEVTIEHDVGVDTSKVDRVKKALEVGLPTLLQAGAKAKIALQAVAHWAETAKTLAASSSDVAKKLGMKAACVTGKLSAAAQAATQVNVRISVSVEASASVGGAASGGTQ